MISKRTVRGMNWGNWFFTSDEHYFHKNIIRYENRPFDCLNTMHEAFIDNHNELVGKNDVTVHAGDFSFGSVTNTLELLKQLNGDHIMLLGSHDYAIDKIVKKESYKEDKYFDTFYYHGRRLEKKIKNLFIVIDHYCIRTWPRSHYNSCHLFGHSHGKLQPIGKSWDIGVDNNNFYPLSFDNINKIMSERPDNSNFIANNLRKTH